MSIYGATDCPLSFYGRKIICGHDIELKVQLAAGVRGAARMKLHGDRAPLRSASKHRATTFIPWDWEACRHQEGEKIKLQGKQYRAGENRRGGTSGGLWKKKEREMTALMRNKEWAQPQDCTSSAFVLPDSIISPIGDQCCLLSHLLI